MLRHNKQGFWENWEESKPELEAQGLIDRATLEQEIAEMRREKNYRFKNAQVGFELYVSNHIYDRIKQRTPGYHDRPNIHITRTQPTRESLVYLGSWKGDNIREDTNCAAPDWLNTLYWEEIDQCITIKRRYPVGTLLYSPFAKKVYVVYDTDSISLQEAEEIEEAHDVYDAAGDYSYGCYPRTDEERSAAQKLFESQQGTIGSLEQWGQDPIHYTPKVFIPDRGGTFAFSEYGENKLFEEPDSAKTALWFYQYDKNEEAKQEAIAFLRERYPEIKLVEWNEFQRLEAQRIY